tara:strand:- start:784 stop:1020 length:237 start_codon:yes stop_codon:yes gene_type:complete
MIHYLDLHGMSHKEALVKVEDALIMASLENGMEFEIITGNSTILQNKIIDEVLGPHNFSHYIPSNNMGMIIVTENLLY